MSIDKRLELEEPILRLLIFESTSHEQSMEKAIVAHGKGEVVLAHKTREKGADEVFELKDIGDFSGYLDKKTRSSKEAFWCLHSISPVLFERMQEVNRVYRLGLEADRAVLVAPE